MVNTHAILKKNTRGPSNGPGSNIFELDQVWSAIFGLGMENFQFFCFGSKKISSGCVKKYPGQSQVGLIFSADQKYARFGSGQVRARLYYRHYQKKINPTGKL